MALVYIYSGGGKCLKGTLRPEAVQSFVPPPFFLYSEPDLREYALLAAMFALSTFCEPGNVALFGHFWTARLFCMNADQTKPASVIPSGVFSRRSFERNRSQPL